MELIACVEGEVDYAKLTRIRLADLAAAAGGSSEAEGGA